MPISIQKIQGLLYKIGFIIDSYFIISDKCEYIKCNSINTGESIIIKISRYFSFRPVGSEGVYNLNLIDFEVGDNVMEKYSEYPSKKELVKKYGNMLKLAPSINDDEMEADLENKYKMNLELKSLEREQLVAVKSCFRQLRRISLVLTGLKYKVCIVHQQYFTVVNDENTIDSFYIRNYTLANPNKMFFIMIDLEYFYEKLATINHDIDAIQESIYGILDKNSYENGGTFTQLAAHLATYNGGTGVHIANKKAEMKTLIARYKAQLLELNKKQDEVLAQFTDLSSQSSTYFNDAAIISQKGVLKKQIDALDKEKQKILKEIITLKRTCDDMYLSTDNVEFDNCILMNGIIKNLAAIKKIDG